MSARIWIMFGSQDRGVSGNSSKRHHYSLQQPKLPPHSQRYSQDNGNNNTAIEAPRASESGPAEFSHFIPSSTSRSSSLAAQQVKFTNAQVCSPSTCICFFIALLFALMALLSGVYYGCKNLIECLFIVCVHTLKKPINRDRFLSIHFCETSKMYYPKLAFVESRNASQLAFFASVKLCGNLHLIPNKVAPFELTFQTRLLSGIYCLENVVTSLVYLIVYLPSIQTLERTRTSLSNHYLQSNFCLPILSPPSFPYLQ